MNTETNISPAPVRRLGGLSNLFGLDRSGRELEVDMSTDLYYPDGVLIDPSGEPEEGALRQQRDELADALVALRDFTCLACCGPGQPASGELSAILLRTNAVLRKAGRA